MNERQSMAVDGRCTVGLRLTTEQRREIAVRLGHALVTVEPTASGARWQLECSCGWGAPLPDGRPTVTRATEAEAARTAVHHVKSAVDRYLAEQRRAGQSFGHIGVSA